MDEAVKRVYPEGLHLPIGNFLRKWAMSVAIATLDQEDHGLAPRVFEETDVLIWWGHTAHGEVKDEIVTRVHKRVLEGIGLVVLHSGHESKIFKLLMGTTCSLKWREAGERERVWVTAPGYPMRAGEWSTCTSFRSESGFARGSSAWNRPPPLEIAPAAFLPETPGLAGGWHLADPVVHDRLAGRIDEIPNLMGLESTWVNVWAHDHNQVGPGKNLNHL
jgi:trehalose utilization protein